LWRNWYLILIVIMDYLRKTAWILIFFKSPCESNYFIFRRHFWKRSWSNQMLKESIPNQSVGICSLWFRWRSWILVRIISYTTSYTLRINNLVFIMQIATLSLFSDTHWLRDTVSCSCHFREDCCVFDLIIVACSN
jgi:hypothetical protein